MPARLSGGMRRRLMVAKAMVHSPPVLVLDEPTAGVDIELREMLWEQVRMLNKAGTTVLLTTHYLQEAQELCDTIAIINHGQVVAMDSTSALLRRLDSKALVFHLERELAAVPDGLGTLAGGTARPEAAGGPLQAEPDTGRRRPGGCPGDRPHDPGPQHRGSRPGRHLPATDARFPRGGGGRSDRPGPGQSPDFDLNAGIGR